MRFWSLDPAELCLQDLVAYWLSHPSSAYVVAGVGTAKLQFEGHPQDIHAQNGSNHHLIPQTRSIATTATSWP